MQIAQLARCYWFTVEFGLCVEAGKRKVSRRAAASSERLSHRLRSQIFGAGILSSFGEIEHAMSDMPMVKAWDPFEAAVTDYPITKYQVGITICVCIPHSH